jgi:hypothetical protein
MKEKRIPLVLLVIIGIALPLLLLGIMRTQNILSNAAAADKLETEGGTLGGNAVAKADSTASGGSFIELGVNPISGCTQISLNTSSAESDTGFAWIIRGSFGDTADNNTNPNQSNLRLFENGIELGPAHATHDDIRNIGQGRFSHWSNTDGTAEAIRFSAKDNSDPRSNGKSYSYCIGGSTSTTPTSTQNPNSPTPTQSSNSPTPTSTAQTGLNIRGFGKNTVGGTGKPIFHVTNLDDSGTGSLRDALSQGNRYIVFDKGGTIILKDYLRVSGVSNITIDGSTAPSPGITITGWPLFIVNNAHDIIVTQIRSGPADPNAGPNAGSTSGDGGVANFSIKDGSYNIVLDHVSARGFTDGGIDLYRNVHDVTVQWSIIGPGQRSAHNYQSLNGCGAQRVTYDHVLFYRGSYRMPEANYADDGTGCPTGVPSEITLDITNSLIYDSLQYGTVSILNSKINVRGSYYYSSVTNSTSDMISIGSGGQAYVSGNKFKNGGDLSTRSTVGVPFPVPSYAQIPIEDPVAAANATKANAGTRVGGLDTTDQSYMNNISIN